MDAPRPIPGRYGIKIGSGALLGEGIRYYLVSEGMPWETRGQPIGLRSHNSLERSVGLRCLFRVKCPLNS